MEDIKEVSLFEKIRERLFDKKYNIQIEDRFLTTDKGQSVLLRSTTSFCNGRSAEIEIFAYLQDKYSENIDIKTQAGMLIGEFYKKYQGSASDLSDYRGNKRPLTKNRGEFSLDIIEVEEDYKNKGIGSLIRDLSTYKFAEFLDSKGIEQGFISGVFAPFGPDESYGDTMKFYCRNGFVIYPARTDIESKKTVLYKPVTAKAVLDDLKNRKFKEVDNSWERVE